jgi:hypothetical protein
VRVNVAPRDNTFFMKPLVRELAAVLARNTGPEAPTYRGKTWKARSGDHCRSRSMRPPMASFAPCH